MKTNHLRVLFLLMMLISSMALCAQVGAIVGTLTVNGWDVQTSKTYDGRNICTVYRNGSLQGLQPGYTSVTLTTQAWFNTTQAGTTTITVHFKITGNDATKYNLPSDSVIAAVITPKKLLGVGDDPVFADSKTYDGNTVVAVSRTASVDPYDILGSDNVFMAQTVMNYLDKNVGADKDVVAKFTLGGTDAGNYEAPDSIIYTASIIKKEVHIANTHVTPSKVYDGEITCEVVDTGVFAEGMIAGDDLRIIPIAKYSDKNVDRMKEVNVSFYLMGTDTINYDLKTRTATLYADITKRQLTAETSVSVSKRYDKTRKALSSLQVVYGKVSGEDVSVIDSALYDNSNVGTNKTIRVQYSLSGADKANYIAPVDSVIYPAEITKRKSTVSDPRVEENKTYDGTDTAKVIQAGTLDSLLPGDNVTLVAEAHYNDSSAGYGKYITIIYHIIGPDSANYETPAPTTTDTIAYIRPKTLNIGDEAVLADTREYNGLLDVQVLSNATLDPADIVPGDDVRVVSTAKFLDPDVGTNKPALVANALAGRQRGNYAPLDTTEGFSSVTKRKLIILPPKVEDSKVYDGTTSSNVTSIGHLTNLVAPDTVVLDASANYDTKDVGYGNKTVNVSYTIIGGNGYTNYSEPDPSTVTNKSITKRKAIVEGTVVDPSKTYDGTDTAYISQTGTVTNKGNDTVTVVPHAHYVNKNAGENKIVIITYELVGPQAGNYDKPKSDTLYSTIDPKVVEIDKQAKVSPSKVYDGNRTCSVDTAGTLKGVVPGDYVDLQATAQYADSVAAASVNVYITYVLTGNDKGNYVLSNPSAITKAAITKRVIRVVGAVVNPDKYYDKLYTANVVNPGQLNAVLPMDQSRVTYTINATYDSYNAGSRTINVIYNLAGDAAKNYTLNPDRETIDGEIKPQLTSVDSIRVKAKEYDGTTLVNKTDVTIYGLNGKRTGDDVRVVVDTAYYSSKNVGDNITVTVFFKLEGAQKDNYSAPDFMTTTAAINKRQLRVSGTQVPENKVYDCTKTVNLDNVGTLDGVIAGDVVTLSATATTDDKNVGSTKSVTVKYSIDGTGKDNYVAPKDGKYTIDVQPLQLTVSGTVVDTVKNYDGTRTANVRANGTLIGKLGNDQVFHNVTASFDDPHVGNGKIITVHYTLSGTDSVNYTAPVDSFIYNCVIKSVKPTVTGSTVKEKVYDGTKTGEIDHLGTIGNIDPAHQGQVILQVESVTFDTMDVADNIGVTIKYYLTGTYSSLYDAPDPQRTISRITRKPVTASNARVDNKIYDGTTNGTVSYTGTLSGIEQRDVNSVSLSATAIFDSKDVALSVPVTVNYSLSGDKSGNYMLQNTQGSTSAKISKKRFFVHDPQVVKSKNYDGTTSVAIIGSGTAVGVCSGDNVNLSISNAYYDNNRVGSNKQITVKYAIAGGDAVNYETPYDTVLLDGEILANKLNVAGYQTTFSKIYDGNVNDTVSNPGALVDLPAGLDVQLHATATYDNKDVDNGKTVIITFSLTGNDRGNYAAPDPITLTGAGVINPKPVTAYGATVASSKIYDGNTSIPVVNPGQVTGIIGQDSVVLATTAAFRDKNVENTAKSVIVTYSLGGSQARNYTLINATDTASAFINPIQAIAGGTNVQSSKNFDGKTSATVTAIGSVLNNVGSDNIRLVPTAVYNDKNVGANKQIIVSYRLAGSDSINYTNPKDSVFNNCAIVAIKPAVVGFLLDSTKAYDGNANVNVKFGGTLNIPFSANVQVNAIGTFDNKNVGTRKDITLSFSLTGDDANNFLPVDTMLLSEAGNITKKQVTCYGAQVVRSKTYDASDSVSIISNGSISTIIAPDVVTPFVYARFRDKNVGTNKIVDIYYTLQGPDSANYTIVNFADTTLADITPKTVAIVGTVVDKQKVYDATTNCGILTHGVVDPATKCDGDIVTVLDSAVYDNKNVDSLKTITVTHHLYGADAANYMINSHTIFNDGVITPASLSVSGLVVDEWKSYDGLVSATLLGSPVLQGVLNGDVVYVTADADFDTPDAGTNKTITVNYNTFGPDARNYVTLQPEIYTINGRIFNDVVLLPDSIFDYKVATDNASYCGGDPVTLLYNVGQGEPFEYRIEFSNAAKAAGFEDIDWTSVPLDITFNVPDSCEGDLYTATIQFRNALQARDFVTNTARDTFMILVNLSNRYITDIFEDVVSIDNRENRFHSYQWYKDGQELAEANLPYYQDKGGLYGEYYVVVNIGEETEATICSKYFDHKVAQKTKYITAYPNPAENELNISLNGFSDETHQLMVVSSTGIVVLNTTFEGDTYQINVGSYPAGTYSVFVDGESVKAIKK